MNTPLRYILRLLWLGLLLPATLAASQRSGQPAVADTVQRTELMPEVEVAAAYKETPLQSLRPTSNTTLYLRRIEQLRIADVKSLSAVVPNLFIPDYGSRMTASVYVRGLGSRIDQPAMGLYVDGIPYFNKNGFDFDMTDVRSIAVLRGPQNTLYGRNTMGGVIDVTTLSPLSYEGSRLALEGGNGGTWGAKLSTYRHIDARRGWSLTASGSHSDGFYRNTATGSDCDWSNTAGLGTRYEQQTAGGLHLSHTAALDWVNQGGYPYRQTDAATGALSPVAYNDRCAYRRLALRDGLTLSWQGRRARYSSATAYQWLDDGMTMDQDFTTASIFTLRQQQQEHTVSQDLVIRPRHKGRWQWLDGINLWGRNLRMQAPVTFKQEGIRTLILDNANKGIHTAFPDMDLSFGEDQFVIGSRFTTRSYGIALYHNSTLTLGCWTLTGGLRVEHEGQHFDYDSEALVHVLLTGMTEAKPFDTRLKGSERQHSLECAPMLSATLRRGAWTWHSSVSRGYKSGGYNTQLFSDLLQTAMMTGLQEALGLSVESGQDIRSVIAYKPEHSWNYETGIKLDRGAWHGELTAFYIDCRNQQLTTFPAGTQTGRMMTNAGRTESYGVEAAGTYTASHLTLQATYGYTHATFGRYDDGRADHRGNRLPYAPEHTLMLGADYTLPLGRHDLTLLLHADWRGAGSIYWDDANTLRQPFYSLLSASATLQWRRYGLKLRGKNLTDTDYRTFYFVSMQRHFLQEGKPLQWGLTLTARW